MPCDEVTGSIPRTLSVTIVRMIARYYAVGLIASMSIGITAFYLVDIKRDLNLTAAMEGLSVSIITLIGACFGLFLGGMVDRTSTRISLSVGLLILALSDIMALYSEGAMPFLMSRLCAGIGFTVLVTAVPAAMSLERSESARRIVLALWGCYVPLGIALGMILSAITSTNWRAAFAIHAFACIVLLAGTQLGTHLVKGNLHNSVFHGLRRVLSNRRILLVAGGFSSFAAIFLVTVSILPRYLHRSSGLQAYDIGLLSTVVSASGVLASAIAAWLLHYIDRVTPLLVIGFAGSAISGILLFSADTPVMVTVGAVSVIFFSGFIPSGIFASLPSLVAQSELGALNGIVAQAGSIGSFVGPPVVMWWTDVFGWSLGLVPFCGFCILGTLFLILASKNTGVFRGQLCVSRSMNRRITR